MWLEHFQNMKQTTYGGLLSIGASATANASSNTGYVIIENALARVIHHLAGLSRASLIRW